MLRTVQVKCWLYVEILFGFYFSRMHRESYLSLGAVGLYTMVSAEPRSWQGLQISCAVEYFKL